MNKKSGQRWLTRFSEFKRTSIYVNKAPSDDGAV